jgi:excisionase family DNA binding protein
MRAFSRIYARKEGREKIEDRHMTNDKELLTAEQLATRLKVRPRTIKSWVRSGRIPVVRVSPKVIRFSWSDVLSAVAPPKRIVRS